MPATLQIAIRNADLAATGRAERARDDHEVCQREHHCGDIRAVCGDRGRYAVFAAAWDGSSPGIEPAGGSAKVLRSIAQRGQL